MFNSKTAALTKECIREVVRVNKKIDALSQDIGSIKNQLCHEYKTTCLSGCFEEIEEKPIIDRLSDVETSLVLIKKKLKIREKKVF